MTRKDFELIARTIKEHYLGHLEPPHREAERAHMAYHFAEELAKHSGNANFDRAKFLKACGVL